MKKISAAKKILINSGAWLVRKLERSNEIRKYKDPRRVAIYEKVVLSKEQKAQIDALYVKNYGEKIPYVWHRHFTAYTGKFDVNYIPEMLFIPEFEHYMNINRDYSSVFCDKNILPFVAAKMGVKTPKMYLSVSEGVYRDADYCTITKEEAVKLLYNAGELFAKPTVETGSGVGCKLLNIRNGVDELSNKKLEEVFASFGNSFVVQERMKCHKSITDIYDGSVNTFRVISYRWREEICRMPVIMRIGSGGNYLDNAHAGGMFIAVDNDGTLHSTAFTEFKKEFNVHPDSGLTFEGHKIEGFEKVLAMVDRMHGAIPQIGVINWDFTINQEGEPVLIEANVNGGSIWLIEMAHGCGVFGDKTEEILQWLKLMNATPETERYRYAFGKM